jgi:hypothetical protein
MRIAFLKQADVSKGRAVLLSPEFLISEFRHVLNVVYFLLGDSPALNFMFLNVDTQNSDAGDSPKRKNTT